MIATFILHEHLSKSYQEKRIKEVIDYEKSGIITSSGKKIFFSSEEKREAK